MKSLFAICLIIVPFALISCGSSSTEESVSPTITSPVTTPTNTTPVMSKGDTGTSPKAPIINTASQAITNSAGLNPAHGQPGHRCDIAVGAPLNSLPIQSTSANNNQPSTITSTTPSQTISTSNPASISATKVAPGMNPAHGQPGHRCDIAVGAPLNSKPSQTTVSNTPSPSNLKSSIEQVSPLAPSKTQPVAVAPGMNPSHGQPGHRCDIAVGSPLNSKPAENTTSPAITTDTTGGVKQKL